MYERVLSELLELSRLFGKVLSEVSVLAERLDAIEAGKTRTQDLRTTWVSQLVSAIVGAVVGVVAGHHFH